MYPNQNPAASALDGILGDIEDTDTQGLSARTPRLTAGQHVVILTTFTGKNSRGAGVILEANFMVEKSSTLQPGEKREWAWFPQQMGDAGKYEKQRIKDFMDAIDTSIGLAPRGTRVTGAELASGKLRGIRLAVSVVQATKKDGTPRLTKKGEATFNATWTPIPQTMEQIAQVGAALPPEVVAAAPRIAAPQAPQAPQYPAGYAHPFPAQSAAPAYPQQLFAAQPPMAQPYAPPAAPVAPVAPGGSSSVLPGILQSLRGTGQ